MFARAFQVCRLTHRARWKIPASAIETTTVEQERAASLRDAETKAIQLFEEIEQNLIRSGISEKVLSDEIHDLATKRHNLRTHWHKRVVRSGPNTLSPFAENPPDRTIEQGDILYIDLGPVFEAWEADFGRTYVLGDDPDKNRLRDALEPMWYKIKSHFSKSPDMTGEELYDLACRSAEEDGWKWGAEIAGHVVGDFPHERIPNDKITLYITKGNNERLSKPGKDGNKRHWILEVHLRPQHGKFGGFYEQLLTVD